MQTTSLLVDGYAVLLLAIAAGLEVLARHTATRSERFRTAGFTYQAAHDLWRCPQDQPLWPHELDREHRVMRYRARATICNACPAKHRCTDSDEGRELVRPIDPWPHSEAGRFHRGISVVLTVLACCFLVAGLAVSPGPVEVVVGLPLLAGALLLAVRWGVDLLRTPSGFPDDPGGRWARSVGGATTQGTGDSTGRVAPVAADGPVLVQLQAPPREVWRRTVWGPDTRVAGARYRRRRDQPEENP